MGAVTVIRPVHGGRLTRPGPNSYRETCLHFGLKKPICDKPTSSLVDRVLIFWSDTRNLASAFS